MTLDISTTHINSDKILGDLIHQSLDKILGANHRIISRELPCCSNQVLLALDDNQRPSLLVFDHKDGGQALLSGLKTLDTLDRNSAWVQRVYPELFINNNNTLRYEDIQLYILAPTFPPGSHYLKSGNSQLHTFTFQTLLVNGEMGLLITPLSVNTHKKIKLETSSPQINTFRSGMDKLEKSEEDYFRNLHISG